MKQIIILIIAFSPFFAIGQKNNSIELGYTRNYASNSLCVIFNHPLSKKSNIYLGGKFHFNNNNLIAHDASGRFFYQLAYSKNMISALGVNLGYKIYPFKTKSNYNPFFFYDLDISKLQLKNNFVVILGVDSVGKEYYSFDRSITKSYFLFHNNIGIGNNFLISNKYSFNFLIGIGVFISAHRGTLEYTSITNNTKYSVLSARTEIIGFEGMPFIRVSVSKKLKHNIN